jgi:hypothetical protein
VVRVRRAGADGGALDPAQARGLDGVDDLARGEDLAVPPPTGARRVWV